MSQRQDLVIFSDQSIIPTIEDESHRMFLITSTASCGPQWLVNALVETHAKGVSVSLNTSSSPVASPQHNPNSMTTILSLAHDKNYYTSNLSKLKVNANQYNIIDCLTDFVMTTMTKFQNNKVKLLTSLVDSLSNDTRQMIILEQPELLLSLVPGLTSDELWTHFVNPIWQKCRLLVISSAIDMFQDGNINEPENMNNRDCLEFQRFVMSCHYKSSVILNLRPLSTGHAKDITGTLKVAKGGSDWNQFNNNSSNNIHVIENEYLYLTEKDSTRLFYG